MLKIDRLTRYRVKKGDSLNSIADCYFLPPALIAKVNSLEREVKEGEIIILPPADHNLYTVRGGDTKEKLCGSKEKFEELNGTSDFFVGMKVFIPF